MVNFNFKGVGRKIVGRIFYDAECVGIRFISVKEMKNVGYEVTVQSCFLMIWFVVK